MSPTPPPDPRAAALPPRRRRRSSYAIQRPPKRWIALIVLGFLLSGLGGAAAYFLPVVTAAASITGQAIQRAPEPTASPGGPAGAGAGVTRGPNSFALALSASRTCC
jgi:hypothetical protein